MKMTDSEQFESALEVFRCEVETAAQCFYSWLSVHEVARVGPERGGRRRTVAYRPPVSDHEL